MRGIQELGLDKAEKQTVIEEYRLHDKDTGSVESQVAVLSTRITELTQHLREHNHDESTRRGLLKMVGKRKSLLSYLKAKDIERYRSIIKKLSIRK